MKKTLSFISVLLLLLTSGCSATSEPKSFSEHNKYIKSYFAAHNDLFKDLVTGFQEINNIKSLNLDSEGKLIVTPESIELNNQKRSKFIKENYWTHPLRWGRASLMPPCLWNI